MKRFWNQIKETCKSKEFKIVLSIVLAIVAFPLIVYEAGAIEILFELFSALPSGSATGGMVIWAMFVGVLIVAVLLVIAFPLAILAVVILAIMLIIMFLKKTKSE